MSRSLSWVRSPHAVTWAGFAAATFLWVTAVGSSSRSFLLSGHGLGRSLDAFETTTSMVSVPRLAFGFVLAAAGAGVGWFLSRGDERERYFGGLAAALVVSGAVVVPWVALSAPETAHGAKLASISRIESALRASGLDCQKLVPVEAADVPSFSAEEQRCLLPWNAAVARGGLATVVLDVWESSSERDRWMGEPHEVGEAAVAGPGSLVRCEFRAICAVFQARTGGTLILPPPGEHFDLSHWRYNVKPFSIEVEHGITGHHP